MDQEHQIASPWCGSSVCSLMSTLSAKEVGGGLACSLAKYTTLVRRAHATKLSGNEISCSVWSGLSPRRLYMRPNLNSFERTSSIVTLLRLRFFLSNWRLCRWKPWIATQMQINAPLSFQLRATGVAHGCLCQCHLEIRPSE